MGFLYRLNKPEYFFRPGQLVRRLFSPEKNQNQKKMPWGVEISYNPNEVLGRSLNTLGVYELMLSECIWRLLNEVDVFMDIGANIGYFSSMALAHPKSVEVYSYEPHPEIFKVLSNNVNFASERSFARHLALSDSQGEAELFIPENFDDNMGMASLEKEVGSKSIKVEKDTLSHQLESLGPKKIGLKIDTEGHEATVMKGALSEFKEGRFAFVFFEEFAEYPSAESFQILESGGYEIFKIVRSFFGPKLVSPTHKETSRMWEPTNFLALPKGSPLKAQLEVSGWTVF